MIFILVRQNGLYLHNNKSGSISKINDIDGEVTLIYTDNNNIYILTRENNLSKIILNFNLNINNNSDVVILNELNYLNLDLDISQLEVINKTNTSATIKSKNNKYFDEFTVNYKIKNKDEVNLINLNELIKKVVFFKFRDENPSLKFKEVKDIDINNFGRIKKIRVLEKNSEIE